MIVGSFDVHFAGPHAFMQERGYILPGGQSKIGCLQKGIQVAQICNEPPVRGVLLWDGKNTGTALHIFPGNLS